MFKISVLLDVQANLPAHFLSAQMALVSTFFQMFIVLGMYNFVHALLYSFSLAAKNRCALPHILMTLFSLLLSQSIDSDTPPWMMICKYPTCTTYISQRKNCDTMKEEKSTELYIHLKDSILFFWLYTIYHIYLVIFIIIIPYSKNFDRIWLNNIVITLKTTYVWGCITIRAL